MPKYENSRDIVTALLNAIHKLFRVALRCLKDGWGEIKKLSMQFWKDICSGRITVKIGASMAMLLILIPALFQWHDGFRSVWRWWQRDELIERYTAVLEKNYETEVHQFFQKYHERFMSRDCKWMAEVAADRAMYDKYRNTKYSNYKCEEFLKTEAKWYLPYKINEPVREDEIVRISGEAVMLLERMSEGTLLMPVKFEIWKRYDWDIWHFSNKPVRIPASIVSD